MILQKFKKLFTRIINARKEKIVEPITVVVDSKQEFKDKLAVITGGNGGIGQEIAGQLLEKGAEVLIIGSNIEKLNKVVHRFKNFKDKIQYLQLDLSTIDYYSKAIDDIKQKFNNRQIDILINCAGIVSKHDFWNTTEEEFDSIIKINLKSSYFFSREIAKCMINEGVKGHILFVSSSSSIRPAWTPYQISKWGLNGFIKGLADLLIPHGIVVNGIAPGPTATDIFGLKEGDSIENTKNPSGRFVTAIEVAQLAVYLVSSSANMVVGDTFFITGGSGTVSMHR